jgi:hypothetical protein
MAHTTTPLLSRPASHVVSPGYAYAGVGALLALASAAVAVAKLKFDEQIPGWSVAVGPTATTLWGLYGLSRTWCVQKNVQQKSQEIEGSINASVLDESGRLEEIIESVKALRRTLPAGSAPKSEGEVVIDVQSDPVTALKYELDQLKQDWNSLLQNPEFLLGSLKKSLPPSAPPSAHPSAVQSPARQSGSQTPASEIDVMELLNKVEAFVATRTPLPQGQGVSNRSTPNTPSIRKEN